MLAEGHEVSCLDEDPESHARLEIGLDKPWEDLGGHFTVGTALEIEALTAAGIERADVFVASTDGDNTNIIIAQIAKRRFNVPKVIARILDPLPGRVVRASRALTRSARRGSRSRCSRQKIREAARTAAARAPGRGRRPRGRGHLDAMAERMYIIIVGAGKVGWNLARELIEKGNEVTLIEAEPRALPDGRAGARAQHPVRRRVRALGARARRDLARRHGDRGDRRRRGQHADLPGREGEVPGRPDHRPRQQPAQPRALRAARRQAGGLGDRPDPAPDRARGARVRARPPARPARAAARDHRDAAAGGLEGGRARGSATCRCPRAAC